MDQYKYLLYRNIIHRLKQSKGNNDKEEDKEGKKETMVEKENVTDLEVETPSDTMVLVWVKAYVTITNKKIKMKEIKMMGASGLKDSVIAKITSSPSIRGICWSDYLWSRVQGKPGFKRYDQKALEEEVLALSTSRDKMVSTEDIVRWRDQKHPNVLNLRS